MPVSKSMIEQIIREDISFPAYAVEMALELQQLRAARLSDDDRIKSVVYAAIGEATNGRCICQHDTKLAIAYRVASQLAR